MTDQGFSTRAIHAGQAPDPATGAVVVPITVASTFAQTAVGEHHGFEYARSGNPTRQALEHCLANLEGGTHGFAFASGLAASDAVLRLAPTGSTVVLGHDAYGGTFRLVNAVHADRSVAWRSARYDTDAYLEALDGSVSMVWIETPTNPLLTVVDIAAVAARAHEYGAIVVVDNTFATPYLQQPLALGADIVVHSTTKYLGGHSDVVGGFVATSDPGHAERLAFVQNAAGAVPGPFDCYLVLRGIKTLAVRMDRHAKNAAAVAAWLTGRRGVAEVFYPGLPTHPTYLTARQQMRNGGGMVSCRVEGGACMARALVARTRVFTLAESLGAVESLIEYPHAMTHASVVGSPLAVPDDLVRLSVGIEDIEDLLDDLDTAFTTTYR